MTTDPSLAGLPDDAAQTELTRQTILNYHHSWKARDLEAVLALYHPQVEYHDFFQQRCLRLGELREYVASNLPRRPGELLEHVDRIRIDGHTAFIQYRFAVRGGAGLLAFRSSEAITVRDGLIWRINEYATLVREPGAREVGDGRAAAHRLGLSARQLSQLAQDLGDYFQRQRPFLDPELDLQRVAQDTGYSRNQISHLLNQVLGQSFYRYVNQARLDHLLQRLAEGAGDRERIDELAFAAGFNSLSAFYKCFRERMGLTPSAYLKQLSSRARTQDSV